MQKSFNSLFRFRIQVCCQVYIIAFNTKIYNINLIRKFTSFVFKACYTYLTVKNKTNFYNSSKCFELYKQYIMTKKHNNQYKLIIYTLIKKNIYYNNLIDKKIKKIDYFFQINYTIIVYITKVHSIELKCYNNKLNKF